jgi:hypothetical protein
VKPSLLRAYKFFKGQYGQSASALSLARAEAWARENDVRATWETDEMGWTINDDDGCPSCVHLRSCQDRKRYYQGALMCSHLTGWHEHTNEVCIVKFEDETEVLGGITDASADYRRVIEAELAGEIMARVVGCDRLVNTGFAL